MLAIIWLAAAQVEYLPEETIEQILGVVYLLQIRALAAQLFGEHAQELIFGPAHIHS